MKDKRMLKYCEIERIFYLLSHKEIDKAAYMSRFEVSIRTYWRDLAFCKERLWNYKVITNKE